MYDYRNNVAFTALFGVLRFRSVDIILYGSPSPGQTTFPPVPVSSPLAGEMCYNLPILIRLVLMHVVQSSGTWTADSIRDVTLTGHDAGMWWTGKYEPEELGPSVMFQSPTLSYRSGASGANEMLVMVAAQRSPLKLSCMWVPHQRLRSGVVQ